MKNFVRRFYLFLIVLFLYMPIFVLIVASFNDSKILGTWKGFTLHWYRDFFENATMMNALRTTLVIALLAAIIATVLGTIACMAMIKMKKSTKNIIVGITNIPMLNAEIVTALAFMLLFIGLGVSLSFSTVLIAHVTFCIPYVVLNVLPKVQQMDSNMYEAALDLGATPVQAFFQVTLPEIMPGILSGFLMDVINMRELFPYSAIFCALAFTTMMFVKHGDSKAIPEKKDNKQIFEDTINALDD